jgi:transposase InsO family protein
MLAGQRGERFFDRPKTEMFFTRDWVPTCIEEFVAELDGCLRRYNEVRIKSPLGFRSPAQHRRRLCIVA